MLHNLYRIYYIFILTLNQAVAIKDEQIPRGVVSHKVIPPIYTNIIHEVIYMSKTIVVKVDEPTHARMSQIKRQMGATFTAQVRIAIKDYIKKIETEDLRFVGDFDEDYTE